MIEIKKVKPGHYILHKDEPYRVIKNQIVVTGTHSHTKNKLEMKGLFNDKYESVVHPPHDKLEDVEIIRKKAQLLSKTGNVGQVMDMVSYETFDANLPDGLNEGDEVTYIEFKGQATILEKR